MKFTHSFIVAAATLNLAIGAPVAEQKSRAVVAKDAVKRAAVNNPYFARNAKMDSESFAGSATPSKIRSVLNLIGRRSSGRLNKRYKYGSPTPDNVKKLNKRYGYGDTPAPWSVEDLNKQ
jgi:hypothetical protein